MNQLVLFSILAACSLNHDYADPAVGGGATALLEMCKSNAYLPCGWVYWFDGPQIEFCIPWADRIGPFPVGLQQSAESLYGSSALSPDARFRGVPICYYQCPSAKGCNATGGCFCLDDQQ